MSQSIKEMQRAYQANAAKLGQAYRPIFEQIEKKLRRNIHAGAALESALLDLSEMLVEAETAGSTVEEVFPDGLDSFYEELAEALPVITEQERASKKKKMGLCAVAVMILVVLLVWGAGQMSLWSDGYVEGQDHPYMYQSFLAAATSYVKGDHDYFFMRGKYLYRFDPETQEVSPLCTQEDCLHARQPDEFKYDICNANVVGDSITNLNVGYHDGYVYYIAYHNEGSYYSLNRVSEDGSQGEQVKRWGNEKLDPWRWIIHRGYLYYLESEYDTEDGGGTHYYVKRLSLEDPEQPEIVFYEDLPEDTSYRAWNLQAYGNGIYMLIGKALRGENFSSTMLYRYDLREKALEEIVLPEGNEDYHILSMTFLEDKLYLYAGDALDGTNTDDRYFVASLKGEEMTALPMDVDGFLQADEKHLYVIGFEAGTEEEPLTPWIYVYDANGQYLDHMSVVYELLDVMQTCLGDEKGILLIDPVDERKVWDVYWIDKADIGTWNGQKLELERVDRMHYGYAYTRYLTEKQEMQE